MEALTVRERILGVHCPEVAHPVVFRGAVCADNGRFDRCEALWLHALDLRQGNNISVQRDLLRFAQLFSQMIHVETVDLRAGNVILVIKSTILELDRNRQKMENPGPKDDVEIIMEEYETNIFTALYLLTIMTKLMKNRYQKTTPENLKDLYRMVFELNKMDVRLRDGQRLLHLSVNGVSPIDDFHTSDVCKFPCLDTVKLLIHCGAKVDCFDTDRNTPLHTLAATFQVYRPASNEMHTKVEEITKLFIDAGIHLDSVNCDGQTAARNCSSSEFLALHCTMTHSHIYSLALSDHLEAFIKRHEINFTTLKCLASRVIAQQRLEYRNNVPINLEKFIQLHSADKL